MFRQSVTHLVICLSVVVWTGAALADQPEQMLLGPETTGGPPRVEIVSSTPGGLVLNLEISTIEASGVALDGRSFRSLALPDGGHLGLAGQPALPAFTRLVALPPGSGARARLSALEMTPLGTMSLAPAAPAGSRDEDLAVMSFDAAWYAQAGPSEPAVTVGEPALLHGLRVVPVTFSPVAYDAATGQTEMARRMTVEIVFDGVDQRNDSGSGRAMIPESFARIYEQEVLGYERGDDVHVGPGSYILICPNNSQVVDIVDKLANWRRRQGYNVLLVTTATTGTTNTAIKNWLQQQYDTLDPPLEFVSLVGDANGSIALPTWNESYSGYSGEGDHFYTTLDGSDPLSDIHIGRISVTSTGELQTVIDKIVDYETTPDMADTSWFTSAGLTGDPATSGATCIYVNQFVKQELLKLNYTRVDTIWGGHFLNQMMASINQGITFFTYRGWLNMSGMSSSHIMNTSNGRKLPFAVILTCSTGDFQGSTTCRSEAFLRAPNGGGIGAIGTATIGTSTRYNNCMFLGIFSGFLNSGDQRTGPALTRGKLNIYKNHHQNEPNTTWIQSTWNNIMGDPATEIYTGVPAILSVVHPAHVSLGANALPVSVTQGGMPVPGARVAVYQAGHIRDFAYSDASGQAVLSIDGAVAGDVLVTVTGTNLRAYLGQTAVGSVTRSLDFHALAIQEVSGNGDDVANPGEILDLHVQLMNHGTSAVTAAAAALSAATPAVTVIDGSANYGTVSAGETAWGTFRVQVEPSAPGGATIDLLLEATGSGQSWTSLVALPIAAPRASLGAMVFSGPGGDLDPGETGTVTFALTNIGNLATGGVSATLECSSQWVTVSDPVGNWGAIPVGDSREQLDTFGLSIAADCLPGHLTALKLTLDFAEGGTQQIEYPIVIGTASTGDPTGPCAYGYWAFDNTDSHPLAPSYDWAELTLIGTNTGISDNSRHDDETKVFDLPFPFTYYGETYERVSICSNGWISFGGTYLVPYRNWVMPADGTPNAMIAAFWTDLAQGQVLIHHDTTGHRFIVQWESFGSYSGGSYPGNCTFQIILLDPAHHATDTGDGPIIIQYKNVTNYAPSPETNYFTTGIQDHTRTVGLTYAFGNRYAGGAATVQPGRAIAFLPIRPQTQGTLAGTVRNASAGGIPVAGATVNVLGAGRQLPAGAGGHFQGGVPVGTWDVAVWHDSFAPDTTYGVTITEDQTTTVDFDLIDIRGPYILETTQFGDTQDTVGPYTIQSTITDMSGVNARFLHYTSSSAGGPFTVPMTLVDAPSGLAEAAIPGQPTGTRVQYWITATDIVGNSSSAPENAPWPPYSFMIAEVVVIEDGGCETPDGWTVNLDGDDTATTGIWEHGEPIGTWYNGQPVQPDGDHTPDGVNCWFTGQHTPGQGAGYNDVDTGHTTLTSPVFDVAGHGTVQVEYYRWFTNDLGNNPGQDPWTVDISNNGGATWTNLEYTLVSNNSWQRVGFVLNDFFPEPDQVRLRFRAEDYPPGALVEAAVDDLRITASQVVADLLPPTVMLTGPAGGSQHANGHVLPVTWDADDDVGVVHARVWLSLDSGESYDMLLGEGPFDGSLDWLIDVSTAETSYACRVRVEVFDGQQRTAVSESATDFTITTGVSSVPHVGRLQLAQNHPNPFNPQTVIIYDLPRTQSIALQIYDLQGKLIRTLAQGPQPAGRHETIWHGRDDRGMEVASGVYFFRLVTEDGTLARKMTLLK